MCATVRSTDRNTCVLKSLIGSQRLDEYVYIAQQSDKLGKSNSSAKGQCRLGSSGIYFSCKSKESVQSCKKQVSMQLTVVGAVLLISVDIYVIRVYRCRSREAA